MGTLVTENRQRHPTSRSAISRECSPSRRIVGTCTRASNRPNRFHEGASRENLMARPPPSTLNRRITISGSWHNIGHDDYRGS